MSVSPYMLQRLIATARQQAEQIQSLQQRLQQVERQTSTTTSTTEVDRAMVEQLVNARVQATRLTFADLSDAEKESLRGRDGADGKDGADGEDGTTHIAGLAIVGGSSAEITDGAASFTIIGGGFAKGESISVSAKKSGFDKLLSASTSKRNDSLTVANENGAFSLDVAADDWGEGIYTILATGDQGNRGATAVLLVDKVDG